MLTYIFSHHNLGVHWSESSSQDADLVARYIVDIDEQDLVVLGADFLNGIPLSDLGVSVLFGSSFLWHISTLY